MPHPLLKPPSSSQGLLQPHVDGSGNSLRVIHGWTSQCETGQDWASMHGIQCLAHIRGADYQGTGGHTVGLRGLSVIRYHVLLTMLAPEWRHPAAPEFDFDSNGGGGPIFGPFFDVNMGKKSRKHSPGHQLIQALNGVLAVLERCH